MPRVLIAHSGRQHSHQAALALRQAGYLACYATGVPVSKRQFGSLFEGWLRRFSIYDDVDLPLNLTRVNMVAPIINRVLARHLPEFIIGPIQYESVRAFDRWVAKLIASNRFDIVIAYENSALQTFKAAKSIGAKCILDAASFHHVEQDRHYVSRLPRAYKARVDRIKDREILLADCIFTASDLAARSYAANTHSGICLKTIPLGVDVDRFKPGWQGRSSKQLAQPFTFVFVGSATVKKGFDLILDCMETLLSEGLSLQLYVVGRVDQELISQRKQLVGMVREYGVISQSQLASVLTTAQCLLLPSRFDSFGMVVTEAMASGLPVIVSDMVGAKDLVEEGQNGFVVPVGSVNALAGKMRWCVLNPHVVRKMAFAARATAERASWTKYRHRFTAAVQEVWLSR
jgi:glycosyltransferase involved in cell wall biosynthesis